VPLHEGKLHRQATFVGNVVSIHASQVTTARSGSRSLESDYDTRGFLLNYSHSIVTGGPLREHRRRIVRRPVIDHHDLEVTEGL